MKEDTEDLLDSPLHASPNGPRSSVVGGSSATYSPVVCSFFLLNMLLGSGPLTLPYAFEQVDKLSLCLPPSHSHTPPCPSHSVPHPLTHSVSPSLTLFPSLSLSTPPLSTPPICTDALDPGSAGGLRARDDLRGVRGFPRLRVRLILDRSTHHHQRARKARKRRFVGAGERDGMHTREA